MEGIYVRNKLRICRVTKSSTSHTANDNNDNLDQCVDSQESTGRENGFFVFKKFQIEY